MSPLRAPGKLVFAKSYTRWTVSPRYVGAAVSDADAQTYLRAVEAADGQALELGVQQAVNQFVLGCKADGTWTAIKASCILAGARTLAGALVPLVGTAPTNNNFVSGDYNRKTGLVGDGTTKYLNSNATTGAGYWSQNANHVAVFVSSAATTTTGLYAGSSSYVDLGKNGTSMQFTNYTVTSDASTNQGSATGFVGMSRSSSSTFSGRVASITATFTRTSASNTQQAMFLFGRNFTPQYLANARLSFYSIGENLDLALLDTRVTALMSALTAAIP